MKLLYSGSVCNSKEYEKILERCRVKPSVSAFVFESALMQGFKELDIDIDVFSCPGIPAFPKSDILYIKKINKELDCGFPSTWVPALNILGLKQKTQQLFSRRMLRKWLKQNKDEEKCILTYSVYQPIAKNIISLCKKYNTRCFAIIADLPENMYVTQKIPPIKKFFTNIYTKETVKLQGKFDGYIYLTEQMKDVINPDAPYTVVEAIANATGFDFSASPKKKNKRAIMYAGALNEKMGIKNLISAFSQINYDDTELWIFGTGDYDHEVKLASENDQRIKFYGFKNRSEIQQFEMNASLLVNVRDTTDTYTKYSFPSKTIEYMLSGTPVLTTKLPGIPDEYFNYTFTIENNSVEKIRDKIIEILSFSEEELICFGLKAQNFVLENKNPRIQSLKILNFIKKNIQ